MPTVCIQCSMLALINGGIPPIFDGTHEEHMRQYHPDPAATLAERAQMERLLAEMLPPEKPNPNGS